MKDFSKLQQFFIIAAFLLCIIILSFVIFIKYEKEQNAIKASFEANQTQILNDNLKESLKENLDKNLTQEKNESINTTFILDFNVENNDTKQILGENLSLKSDENLSLDLNSSVSLDENLSLNLDLNSSFDENLSKNLNQSLNIDKNSAKLAIIIDDIATKEQVKEIKSLNLKIIPSFFPHDKVIKNTKNLAKEFDFYMIHLPLEAKNYKDNLDTLSPNDSAERIERKISQIRADFDNSVFINNHTGSLYTSDLNAMMKLYESLNKYKFIFLDSKTSPHSKAKIAAKNSNQIYLKRDVFLDNKDDIKEIKSQLEKAVKIAQKTGFAVAIAHPKKATFLALKQSKNLLKNVKLVYLSEIYDTTITQ